MKKKDKFINFIIYFPELFPQLDHQKRVIAKSIRKKKTKKGPRQSPAKERATALKRKRLEDKVPKAYKLSDRKDEESSSDESVVNIPSEEEKMESPERKSDDDSGLDSDSASEDKYDNVQVSSLLSDMQKLREEMIKRNEYEKLKEKCKRLADEEEDED